MDEEIFRRRGMVVDCLAGDTGNDCRKEAMVKYATQRHDSGQSDGFPESRRQQKPAGRERGVPGGRRLQSLRCKPRDFAPRRDDEPLTALGLARPAALPPTICKRRQRLATPAQQQRKVPRPVVLALCFFCLLLHTIFKK